MRELTMWDYVDRVNEDLQTGRRIWLLIDGIPTPATKQEAIDAIKAFKTVQRMKDR